ncbi:uncharacterized protein cd8b [Eucyclogobius newberryi]|uniref:uncharacterized protein cd8b n=1 Tax=Eucyclogobius newberryi TaxID=166745 RepID=UPI003B5CCD64
MTNVHKFPGQNFARDPVRTLYPPLGEDQSLECDCETLPCEQVTWFRTLTPGGAVQFLGRSNQADRVSYAEDLKDKFQISRAGSGYSLRVLNTSTADRGVYSCVLKIRKTEDLWRTGVILRPGESPDFDDPVTATPPGPSHCHCNSDTPTGCGSMVLWPLVGLSSALSLTLLCTIYYYYNLPRKCRHRFVKKK